MIISVFTRLILAAYFLEAGLILIVAPWSAFWDRNLFTRSDIIGPLADNPFVRGAISGVGLLTAAAGFVELAGVFRRKSPTPPQDVPTR